MRQSGKQNLILSLIIVAGLTIVSQGLMAEESFQCRESTSVEANEKILIDLDKQIDTAAYARSTKTNVDQMLTLIQKVLCYHQIQGGLEVFEYISSFKDSPVFQSAKKRLNQRDFSILEQALKY